MNYRWYKVKAIWEDNTELEFVVSGVDANSTGLTVSKLEGIKIIKDIQIATKDDLDKIQDV